MTAVADQPVRAAGRDGGASRAAAARPGPAPRTTPLALPPGAVPATAVLRGWSWIVDPVDPRDRGWGWATGRPGHDWAVAGAPLAHRRTRPPATTRLPATTRPPTTTRPPATIRLPVAVRAKLRDWGRRYLLAEVVGTLAALTAALTVHALTGSLAPAALAGSVAESVAYYGVILRRAIPTLQWAHAGAGPVRRLLRTGRSLLAETSDFVAAELADTFLIRPGLIYLAAGWAGSGVAGGLLVGKLLADVGFYAVVIPSYELRRRLMHR
jgi:hypothetical protein